MTPESVIRYGAISIVILAFLFVTPVRDYAITVVTLIVLFYSAILLAACVCCPEEVALWLKKHGWFK